MAFIPDDALDRYEELQPKSQIAYSFLCRYRNHTTGQSRKTLKDCAEKYGWSRATYFNVKKELENGWIDENFFLQVGDFSPVEKSKNLDSEDEGSLKKYTEKSKNLDKKSKKLDPHIRNTSITSNNQQEEKKVSNETAKKKDFPVPDNFSISDSMREWAAQNTPGVNLEYHTAQFVDHYKNAIGKKALGRDWVAKWRTWIRNEFTDFGKCLEGKPIYQNGATENGIIQKNNQPSLSAKERREQNAIDEERFYNQLERRVAEREAGLSG